MRRGLPELVQLQLGGANEGRDAPDFCAKAKLGLAQVLADARDVLLALGWTLSPDHPDCLSGLLDNRPLPLGSTSASHLRVIKYVPGTANAEHVDRGLLTFAFARSGDSQALEVLDQRRGEWVRPPASTCVLLVGHTLETATAGAFTACRHRVAACEAGSDRLSLAFQIRARPTATLDVSFVPVGLRRNAPAPNGQTVAALMADFSRSHVSVVGLGNSLGAAWKWPASHSPDRPSQGRSCDASERKRQRVTAPHEHLRTSTLRRTHVSLNFRGQDGKPLRFRVKVDAPMRTAMDLVCARMNVAPSSVAFMAEVPCDCSTPTPCTAHQFISSRISPSSTPLELEFEDGDEIDVMGYQVGD